MQSEDSRPLLEHSGESSYSTVDNLSSNEAIELEKEWQKRSDYLQSIKWYRRPHWAFISFSIFLFTFTSVGEPIRKVVRFKLACNSLLHDGVCNRKDIQILVSDFSQYDMVVSQLVLVAAAAAIGKLTNIYGRKLFISLISVTMILGRSLLLILMLKYERFMMKSFLLCDIISCLTGGILVFSAIADSYITDVVHHSDRLRCMSYVHGGIFAGGTLGPLLSNVILSYFTKEDIAEPNAALHYLQLTRAEITIFQTEILLFVVLLGYSIFILPESKIKELEPEDSSDENSKSIFNLEYWRNLDFLSSLKTLIYEGNQPFGYGLKAQVFILVSLHTLMEMFEVGVGEVAIDYGVYMFDWGNEIMGVLFMIFSFTRVLVLYFIFPFYSGYVLTKVLRFRPAANKFDNLDCTLLVTGLAFNLILYFGLSTAANTREYLTSIVFGSVNSTIVPTIHSIVPKFYPKFKVSEVIMALSLITGVFTIIAPIIFINVYQFGLKHEVPALVYHVCIVLNVVALILILCSKSLVKR